MLRGPVELALAKKPGDRPTAAQLLTLLVGGKPVPPPGNPRRRRIAAASAAAVLALNRPATASSLESDRWNAGEAVDGDPQSRWSSGFGDPQWLTVDLGNVWRPSEVVLRWENAHATAYRVEVSTDRARWTRIYATSAGQGGVVAVDAKRAPGRYVRVYCTRRSNQYVDSLYELEVR